MTAILWSSGQILSEQNARMIGMQERKHQNVGAHSSRDFAFSNVFALGTLMTVAALFVQTIDKWLIISFCRLFELCATMSCYRQLVSYWCSTNHWPPPRLEITYLQLLLVYYDSIQNIIIPLE